MKTPDQIQVLERFAPLRRNLLGVLDELSGDDWNLPTIAPLWSVKDIVGHLLADDVAILSGWRDGYRLTHQSSSNRELIDMVNRLNGEWVQAMRRVSPRLLRELLAETGPPVDACFAAVDPLALGSPVSWAGPESAPMWFNIAREFTERWHHQQQIRDAASRPPLDEPYFFSPVLETFVRALPYSFRNVHSSEGTTVQFEISGAAGRVWFIHRLGGKWILLLDGPGNIDTRVVIPQAVAWRLFTKGIDPEKARRFAFLDGNTDLAAPIFTTIAVIG